MHAATPDLAGLARLLADGTRASFCLALLDGRAWTAAELARHAGVAPSTATGHLNLLVAGGLLAQERQGRHRYVRLADSVTAELTRRGLLDREQGLTLTGDGACWFAALDMSLAAGTRRPLARSCLDWTERRPHLAGAAGAALCSRALGSRWITRIGTGRAVALTDAGREALHKHLGLVIG